MVSTEALIILPKNVGLQPVATTKDLDRELKRAQRILDAAPRAADIADSLSADLPTFALVADAQREERERLDAMEQILDDVEAGILRPPAGVELRAREYARLVDRAEAIERAVRLARPDETILVAGKGHEAYKDFGDTVVPFDDREHARRAMDRFGPAGQESR